MKHSAVRDTIIATASDLFYRKGYKSSGINEVIREAGIAKATLYNHFRSKGDLCLAYLQSRHASFQKDIDVFCRKEKAGKAQLLALFDFLNEFFKTENFSGCWAMKTISEITTEDERIRGEIQSQKKDLLNFISALLRENYSDKSDTDNLRLSRQLYLLYEGAVAESHLHQDNWPIEAAKEVCDQLLG